MDWTLIFTKFLSRKFIAWIVASVALFTHYLPSSDWMMITLLYLGVEGAIDKWPFSRKEITNESTTNETTTTNTTGI